MELEQTAAVADSPAADAAPSADVTSAPAPETSQPDASAATADENAELLSLLNADDGLEEIEHDGIKAKVPKELKAAFLRHKDYTQKTQEVADQRRQIEAQAAEQRQQNAFHLQHIAEVAGIVSIENQLAEYDKVDWQGLINQNPQQAQILDMQRRELQGKKSQLVQNLTQRQQQQTLNEQQATARQLQESQRELERDINGWSPELAGKLMEYGKKSGFPQQVLSTVTQAVFVKTLHKAYQWDQLMAQRSAKPPAAPATPVTRIGARASTAVVDMDKLTPDEWRKAREAQIEARRKKR